MHRNKQKLDQYEFNVLLTLQPALPWQQTGHQNLIGVVLTTDRVVVLLEEGLKQRKRLNFCLDQTESVMSSTLNYLMSDSILIPSDWPIRIPSVTCDPGSRVHDPDPEAVIPIPRL